MSEDTEKAPGRPGQEMPLMSHLGELRTRLVRCLIAAVVGFFSCFAFHERILIIMLQPLKDVLPADSKLITTTLTEGFGTSMKAAFVAGLFLTSPFIFYQIWKFVAPGLYKDERTIIIPVAFFTALFFCFGALFGYFLVFPFGFSFLAHPARGVRRERPHRRGLR
ncbi:MAG: twin-arginine translocase subunit TatC, partial [Desulfovibrionaceae bacterium]|nr:twin-arginine translocase subunit TatC [Desulfovibrionaceae bacterium]